MLKICVSILAVLLLPIQLWSQEDICIGKKQIIYSTVLGEERTYWIHLPDNYAQDGKRTYPVIYLLDGDSFFHTLVGITKTLSSGKKEIVPASIIIGVLNTDRTRDLTPTSSNLGRDGKVQANKKAEGGGSEKFDSFLVNELRAYVDTSYRTNGRNMLIGHSYAGLFGLNTFLQYPDQFNKYLLIDPSLWWDGGRLVKEAERLIKNKDYSDVDLYIGIATQKRTALIDFHLDRADELCTQILPNAKNLNLITKSFPEETHGTVAISGIYDGLKQLSTQ